MKKLDVGQAVGVIANLGVIAGLVFFGLELQQNQRMVMAQTRNEITRTSIDLQLSNREPSQAGVILRGNRGDELTDEESYQFSRWAAVQLEFWENVDYQYRQGLLDEEEYGAHLNRVRSIVVNRGLRDYFCMRRERYTPDFVTSLDRVIDPPCSGNIETKNSQ